MIEAIKKRMKKIPSIVWFRQDLRLSDNPALAKASSLGDILPIYIWDDLAPKEFKVGATSKVWLHHSLEALNQSLDGKLNIYQGSAEEILALLIERFSIENIFWNTSFEPWYFEQESKVKQLCDQRAVSCTRYNSNYLWHPNDILKNDASPYKVFTAYKKKSYQLHPRKPVSNPSQVHAVKDTKNTCKLTSLPLLPTEYSWHEPLIQKWKIGESAAKKRLKQFVENNLSGYKSLRDFPEKNATSLLSPHLHFGEISPAQVWDYTTKQGTLASGGVDIEHFLSEVIWREFSVYLLFHFKNLHKENFNSKFDSFPWKRNQRYFTAWKKGKTGYPIVDAGMRELWETGYMHNRVRMIVASFLVKNLGVHWHAGRDWFWDCLLDADLANNSASWQWVAGCGADAAPYFRIFNPITQGEKFDKEGEYTRKWVPELKELPNKYLFKPWEAPSLVLRSAGVILGQTYPEPLVDVASSREQALAAYRNL